MMNLTRMYQSPEDYLPPLSAEVLEDHEEMELLLEAYLQVGDSLFPSWLVLSRGATQRYAHPNDARVILAWRHSSCGCLPYAVFGTEWRRNMGVHAE